MTSLLPPNLLKLFQPRPHPQYLKPLTPDPAKRGPDKLTGVAALLARLKAEAEEDELKQGMADKPVEDGEGSGQVKDEANGESKTGVEKDVKPTLAGEYARELRLEKRKKRQEKYKKELEKKCETRPKRVFR